MSVANAANIGWNRQSHPTRGPEAHSLSYRSEIDGLRSIAVLPVLLFHFSVPGFSGGFVGVDIFFVISGYLIGRLLWSEFQETGRIQFPNFYARRFRRLAPAYFAMALTTTVVAFALLLPLDLREYGKELLTSALYLSNILFFRQSGYFDTAAEEKLLLHTWSLSVEEQFYIFLPCAIMLAASVRLNAKSFVIALFAMSALACIVVTGYAHNATFYLFPFRAWELLAGVLLAIYSLPLQNAWRETASANLHSLPSWCGACLLLISIFMLEPGKNFPGYHAILPVVGTTLILFNGTHPNSINSLLSTRPLVLIGLMSYSIYLWHWPVLTLSNYYYGKSETAWEVGLWILLVFILSWLSWKFIERPVRRATWISTPTLLSLVALGTSCLVATGWFLYRYDGMTARFSPITQVHIKASHSFLQDWTRCHHPKSGPLAGLEVCPIGPPNKEPQFLAWGDSHLRAFKEGLDLAAREQDVPGLIVWHAGCPPLFDVTKQEKAATAEQDAYCSNANARIKKALPQMPNIKKILLVGRWAYYAQGTGVGSDKQNRIRITYAPSGSDPTSSPEKTFSQALRATVNEMRRRGREVHVLRQVPEIPYYSSRQVARNLAHGRLTKGGELDRLTTVKKAAAAERNKPSEKPINQLAKEGKLNIINSWGQLCTNTMCSTMQNGDSYYFDNNHMNNHGAIQLRKIFSEFLKPLQ